MVAHHAVDKAKELLRSKIAFVWDATHLSVMSRTKTIDLLFAYGAEVELIYLEQPRAGLLRRNSGRDTSLSNKTLQGTVHKSELPLRTETHAVVYQPA